MRNKKNSFQCQCKPATHAFCNRCQEVRQVAFKKAGGTFTKYQGGKLVCLACDTVLVNLYREQSDSPREEEPKRARLAYRTVS